MKIYVFTHTWNEDKILPYFLRHYSTFADWIFIYDQHSKDKTEEIASKWPMTTVYQRPDNGFLDRDLIEFCRMEYRQARGCADWVMWPDVDEFIYHPEMRMVLQKYLEQGVEVPLLDGYQMIGKKFPVTNGQIYQEINCGYPCDPFCKPIVFRPYLDMQWVPGKHKLGNGFNPNRSKTAEIKLFHYRFIDPDYVRSRNERNWIRMDNHHRRTGCNWTCKPGYTGEHSTAWYMKIKERKFPRVV